MPDVSTVCLNQDDDDDDQHFWLNSITCSIQCFFGKCELFTTVEQTMDYLPTHPLLPG